MEPKHAPAEIDAQSRLLELSHIRRTGKEVFRVRIHECRIIAAAGNVEIHRLAEQVLASLANGPPHPLPLTAGNIRSSTITSIWAIVLCPDINLNVMLCFGTPAVAPEKLSF